MKTGRYLFLFCAHLFFIISGFSQEIVIRPYLGVAGGNLIFAGSFDGSSYFQTDQDILLVPKINPAFGLGAVIGIRLNNGAAEAGYYYYRSDYTTMETDYAGECSIHLIRFLGITKYFNKYADGVMNPYFDFDMSASFSVFEKIAYPYDQFENSASGSYGAFILGLGGGTLVKISDRLSLDLKLLAEYYMGTDIRVKGRDRYEIQKFGSLLLNSTLGIKYYFKPI
jgi:hypothetical protein